MKILVLDDHESVLEGTIDVLTRHYPDAEILTAQTAESAKNQVETSHPDLLVTDLSIPEKPGEIARSDSGVQLLRTLMKEYPTLNIVVQSAHVRSLVRLKPTIDTHEGGFTIADKSLPMKEMLAKVDWAMQGVVYTPKEMRSGLEVKPEWLQMLKLAFEDGLQDKAIAQRMNVAERTVRHYWNKVQDALGVYPEDGKNIRIQTEIQAREEGLID
ncbi:MAG TPA: response regulator receiver protein [Cyanobacteria bacterium UBA11149]|nr:response regulator receiver protein [Cyanobacteria bacterium UBA11367]HBE59945.1 response regulator receiver protein [Cyanobacteria bacterium UBA11366]HBK64672.1 response regulator receiver protein [Cyanobacteria bacterium UBA11166]HBR74080.1 response regulator receiver protein [Cyanobacteria bacterium UBA11159]HBS69323.1 response regulator receiver protein [Cyanobacteria bacterium UBA11153]HBW89701.1 response regulator receiver protein [Cyanobacteria bacterium UBA11149]HCA93339.1 response